MGVLPGDGALLVGQARAFAQFDDASWPRYLATTGVAYLQ